MDSERNNDSLLIECLAESLKTAKSMITDNTTYYKKKGLPQEALANGVHLALAKKHGLDTHWTGKESYEDSKSNKERHGVDSKLESNLFLRTFSINSWLVVECKNFSKPIKQYTKDTAYREVISRAELLDALHKLLVIPNFDVFTKKARGDILRNKWQVFETGKVITFEDFENGTAITIAERYLDYLERLLLMDIQVEQYLREQIRGKEDFLEYNLEYAEFAHSVGETENKPAKTKLPNSFAYFLTENMRKNNTISCFTQKSKPFDVLWHTIDAG